MRIGQLARSVGVDTQTVRFYEREGLLPPPDRQENGYRVYTEKPPSACWKTPSRSAIAPVKAPFL